MSVPDDAASDGASTTHKYRGGTAGLLIGDRDNALHLFVVLSGEDADVLYCAPVLSERIGDDGDTIPSTELEQKRIAIVGLGSAGSKIAITLARMRVRGFYLVDHDLLLPENLHRHALDWQEVTQHKVDAVGRALVNIDPVLTVGVSQLHVSGQESNAAVSGALARVAECDVIVDATANARVFNLLAAVSRSAKKPLVWLEVFGGGIGGLIARSRPGVDPSPQDMRSAYLSYCDENPAPPSLIASVDYSQEDPQGRPLVASDASVSIIAHHAAQFVPDCFSLADQSAFPHSMYLIGLAKGWVFDAPFRTIPISTSSLPVSRFEQATPDVTQETIAFLAELVRKTNE